MDSLHSLHQFTPPLITFLYNPTPDFARFVTLINVRGL